MLSSSSYCLLVTSLTKLTAKPQKSFTLNLQYEISMTLGWMSQVCTLITLRLRELFVTLQSSDVDDRQQRCAHISPPLQSILRYRVSLTHKIYAHSNVAHFSKLDATRYGIDRKSQLGSRLSRVVQWITFALLHSSLYLLFSSKKKRFHHQLCVWTVEWMSRCCPADNWKLHSGDFSNIQTIVRTIRVESQHTSSTINALTMDCVIVR